MARYIDAELLKEDLRRGCWSSVQKVIDRQPTADVQPVIHCKDCKYWCHNQGSKDGWCVEGIPINGDDMSRVMVDDYDFCSYAEREE